ncbi:MAG: glycosyltransferase family 2 protein [Acidobacteriota bacterium]
MTATDAAARRRQLAVVIPCYRAARHVGGVIDGLPSWVTHIVAVDDACPDGTGAVLDACAARDRRVVVEHHARNRGVGGAMATGLRIARALGADVIVKMDADGQMDPAYLPDLLRPLLEERADFAKGNRFQHLAALSTMPVARRVGNVGLSFLTKAASGCWHVFDVQNGYLAMTGEVLDTLPLAQLDVGYAFENSLLVHVAIQNFAVVDVPMPAIYGDEVSNLRIGRALVQFPPRLLHLLLRRLVLRYGVHDLSPVLLYLVAALALGGFGTVFGGYHWWHSIASGVPATTGTVVLALLPLLMSFNLLLQAIDLDIRSAPRPRHRQRRVERADVPGHFQPGAQARDVDAAGDGSVES